MAQPLSEDDIYRTSTQYRLWSFSPESLASQRKKTHELAVDRAQRYADRDTHLLTEGEELRLVQRYCEQIRTTSDHFKWPVNVKATAVQYLRRFYLSNSCITYPPKEIYKTVLFLASKSEATHVTLADYARRISTDPEAILAAEYKVMQALRFTLDVRQPFRGLKGCLMELLNMAEGMIGHMEGVEEGMSEGTVVAERTKELPSPGEGSHTKWTPPSNGKTQLKHVQDRIQAAYSAARVLLDGPASLTDVYFLYTPSQILLAALQLADGPLTGFYLSSKLPTDAPVRPKILATISACADMLAAFNQSQVLTKDERAKLEERLEKCRDPSTKDLVKAFAAMRQDGTGEDGAGEEKAKRRKVAREKNEKEGQDLFGPSLTASGT
ncbi:uncharacterized protein LTR77_008560 [Saxophila tyrrhenica]|uniref:RNA polymerase II holoenzyme cyclin-like subunit n=1 Tax=Saxophila tyrrhenica TaxID=1690608 RepID=A0AAV9P192_9PEZI|nr:hypothetical protein LTR77_008560 [Saxophila tyrrhenica]